MVKLCKHDECLRDLYASRFRCFLCKVLNSKATVNLMMCLDMVLDFFARRTVISFFSVGVVLIAASFIVSDNVFDDGWRDGLSVEFFSSAFDFVVISVIFAVIDRRRCKNVDADRVKSSIAMMKFCGEWNGTVKLAALLQDANRYGCYDVNMTRAIVRGGDLASYEVRHGEWVGVDAYCVRMYDINFKNTDVSKSRFERFLISNARFENDTSFDGAEFVNGDIADVIFHDVQMSGCVFSNVRFYRCSFFGAVMDGSVFDCCYFDHDISFSSDQLGSIVLKETVPPNVIKKEGHFYE